MSRPRVRAHSRGSAGTLRRLGPSSAVYRPRRGRPAVHCLIRSGSNYLAGINPDRTAMVSPDPTVALRFPVDVGRQVAAEMVERGWDAELVPAPRAD